VALAACGGAQAAFDPSTLSQNTDAMLNTMSNSQAVQSLDGLGDKMTVGAPSLAAAAMLRNIPLEAQGFAAWAARRLQAFESAMTELSVAAPNALIPATVLGKTFIYNTTTNTYVLSDRTGAPSNGVRFVLYAVAPITHAIVTPLNEIGYVDLKDESAGSAVTLHVVAVVTSKTLIDYKASATVTTTNQTITGASVTVSGFVSDGTTQLDFTLSQTFNVTSGLSVDYQLAIAEKRLSAHFVASFTPAGVGSITVTFTDGTNTTVITATGGQASFSGQITHNGTVVVKFSGTTSNLTFTDASGGALTDAQVTNLKKVGDFVDGMVTLVDQMLKPAHKLLTPGLAI
jgi:hypothetical protein